MLPAYVGCWELEPHVRLRGGQRLPRHTDLRTPFLVRSTFAVDGKDCRVHEDVERVLKEFHKAGKPIGYVGRGGQGRVVLRLTSLRGFTCRHGCLPAWRVPRSRGYVSFSW